MGGMVTRAELKSYLDGLKTSFLENPGTTGIEKTISAKIDDIILGFWHDREPPKSFALLAIGGYGRGTIHPESDIDLLFFFKHDIDEEAIKGAASAMGIAVQGRAPDPECGRLQAIR